MALQCIDLSDSGAHQLLMEHIASPTGSRGETDDGFSGLGTGSWGRQFHEACLSASSHFAN